MFDPFFHQCLHQQKLTNFSENHYETSSKTLEEFKKTLDTFKRTLKRNRVGEKLNIELKDEYGFKDVVEIATRLKDGHEGNDLVSTCMTKIKSAFRKRKGVLANLANFAPNDSYGVVLCGGLTVILGVSSSYLSLFSSPLRPGPLITLSQGDRPSRHSARGAVCGNCGDTFKDEQHQ